MTTTKTRRTIGTINSGLEVTGEVSADEVGSTVVLKHICYLLKFVYINPTTYKDPVIISVLYLLGGCGLMLKFCCLDVVGGVCTLDRSKYYTGSFLLRAGKLLALKSSKYHFLMLFLDLEQT